MDDDTSTDAALMRRLASGDRAALADAFDRFAPTLTRSAWAQADSPDHVEALVQDTFLTLWQQAPTTGLVTSALLPWLLAVCRDHARSQAPRSAEHEGQPSSPSDADGLRWVRDEIAALAPIDQRLVELCLVDGHSYAEAARLLGLRAQPVTKRTSRPRQEKAVMHDEH
ncbi:MULTISPECIES: RNA polymerase sigma factor [unclassified Curtobacterium]|uniref:RNA polymerase sigma factor n=1 Tax=unclassified Curtobacterium TaxID=257496 RepID=UPI00226B50FA|nr:MULTISPECIES: RNA polymerase sigma factor [unclassified Curtobacterium]